MDPFDVLAQYNAEVARGIMHTKEWKAKMAEIQAQWGQMQHAMTNAFPGNTFTELSTGSFQQGPKPWWQLW